MVFLIANENNFTIFGFASSHGPCSKISDLGTVRRSEACWSRLPDGRVMVDNSQGFLVTYICGNWSLVPGSGGTTSLAMNQNATKTLSRYSHLCSLSMALVLSRCKVTWSNIRERHHLDKWSFEHSVGQVLSLWWYLHYFFQISHVIFTRKIVKGSWIQLILAKVKTNMMEHMKFGNNQKAHFVLSSCYLRSKHEQMTALEPQITKLICLLCSQVARHRFRQVLPLAKAAPQNQLDENTI